MRIKSCRFSRNQYFESKFIVERVPFFVVLDSRDKYRISSPGFSAV